MTKEEMHDYIIKQKKQISKLETHIDILNYANTMNIPSDAMRRQIIKHELDFQNLHDDISATMVWSYKYQTLITPSKMEEIKEEEQEYIDRHNKTTEELWKL